MSLDVAPGGARPLGPPAAAGADLAAWLGVRAAERWQGPVRVGGESSRVVVALDSRLGRRVAVKVLLGTGASAGVVPLEAEVQARLSWHAHVLTLHECGVAETGVAYLVLEHAAGGTLAARRWSAPDLLARGAELAGALAACHRAGVVHGDVKPSNVLVGNDGTARLADFGIAGTVGSTLATLDDVRGSLHFAAPEVLAGSHPTPASDVYSLAATLWSASTGRVPFGGAGAAAPAVMARAMSTDLSFAGTPLASALGTPAFDALDAALARQPECRPSAAALAAALAPTVVAAAVPPDRRRRRRAVLATGVACVVALAAGLVVGRSTDAAPAVVPYCTVYRAAMDGRAALLAEIAGDLEISGSPTDVVERLLHRYPARFARMTRPWLERTASLPGPASPAALSTIELEELSVADSMLSLRSGKPVADVVDGDGFFDAGALPGDLQRPAAALMAAGDLARRRCPTAARDLRAAKARMSSTIVSNLTDPTFMQGFFEDPRSLDLLTARDISLMASTAGLFFARLLDGHWAFLLRAADRHPDIRTTISFEHPDLLLTALANEPALLDMALAPAWIAELKLGLDRLTPGLRGAVVAEFAPQLAALGVR